MIRSPVTHAALALAAIAAVSLPSAAHAGTCPAGQARPNAMPPSTLPAKGVTDTVLNAIDLAAEPVGLQGRQLRLRRLTIAPGGVVPFHSHGERPAIIYVVSGTVTEYASTCAVPIVHRAGEATPEMSATSHWWRNTGRTPAVLLSSDLFPVAADPKAM